MTRALRCGACRGLPRLRHLGPETKIVTEGLEETAEQATKPPRG